METIERTRTGTGVVTRERKEDANREGIGDVTEGSSGGGTRAETGTGTRMEREAREEESYDFRHMQEIRIVEGQALHTPHAATSL